MWPYMPIIRQKVGENKLRIGLLNVVSARRRDFHFLQVIILLGLRVRIRTFSFGGLLQNAAAGPVAGVWMFFGLSGHLSKLANIQMSFNRPLEQHFYDPKCAKVNLEMLY